MKKVEESLSNVYLSQEEKQRISKQLYEAKKIILEYLREDENLISKFDVLCTSLSNKLTDDNELWDYVSDAVTMMQFAVIYSEETISNEEFNLFYLLYNKLYNACRLLWLLYLF